MTVVLATALWPDCALWVLCTVYEWAHYQVSGIKYWGDGQTVTPVDGACPHVQPALSGDGARVAVAPHWPSVLVIADTATGEVLTGLSQPADGDKSVVLFGRTAWSAEADVFAAAGEGASGDAVWLWQGTRRPPVCLPARPTPLSFALDGAGRRLATVTRGQLAIWDTEAVRRERTIKAVVLGSPISGGPIAFSADGSEVVVADSSSGVLGWWLVETGRLLREAQLPSEASGGHGAVAVGFLDQRGVVAVADMAGGLWTWSSEGLTATRARGPGEGVLCAAICPASGWAALLISEAPRDYYIAVFDIRSGRRAGRFGRPPGRPRHMAASRDGRVFALAGDTVYLWRPTWASEVGHVRTTQQ
ncbi:MAG: WD40 repeat domain-containing protein [Armatimonadetes bacterium]|nr:WD40 repeat domain-containing protein [Armatimonadota bacterium]